MAKLLTSVSTRSESESCVSGLSSGSKELPLLEGVADRLGGSGDSVINLGNLGTVETAVLPETDGLTPATSERLSRPARAENWFGCYKMQPPRGDG